MAEKKQLIPALEVVRTPGGTLRCPEGAQKRVLLEETPRGQKLKIWKPAATPQIAGCSRSAPLSQRARRSLRMDEINRALIDSSSEDGDSSGDDFEDYLFLRQESRQIRDLIEEECEEGVNDEHERVVEGAERVDEQDDERMLCVNQGTEGERRVEEQRDEIMVDVNEGMEGEGRVEEQGDETMVGVNEEIEGDDSELRAMRPECVNLNDFSWSDDFSSFSGQEETYLRTPGVSFATQDPVEAFVVVWNEDIMKVIVKETNAYAWSHIAPLLEDEVDLPEPVRSWCDTTVEEMYVYFAILILMSVCNRSVVKDYWTTGIMGMPDFRRLMSRNRYLLLSKFLHFVDNDTLRDTSLSSYEKKIKKIAPILDHCNERFAALYVPNKHLSLDESLLLWKGRLSWVQCIRTKAARFGIKSYELCEAQSGYLLRCILYAGKDSTMRPGPLHGFENVTAKVVLELMEGYLDVGHCLVMDNWYNQLSLTRYLKGRATDVIGTMNPRRVDVPNDIKYAKSLNLQRGNQIARHCGDITLIAWKDVKLVTAVSTYHTNQQTPARRAGIDISKPVAIVDYNKYMGGVDSKDQQLSTFLMERKKGKKWYMKVFKRLLNTSLLNTFVIFRKNPTASKPLSHREYRLAVAKGLFTRFNTAGPGVIRPNMAESASGIPRRLIKGVEHFPVPTELRVPDRPAKVQKRCTFCHAAGKRTMVTLMCSYCEVALCAGQCWVDYHNKEKL